MTLQRRKVALMALLGAHLALASPAAAQTADEFRLGLAIMEQILKMIDQMDPAAKRMLGGIACSFIDASAAEMSPAMRDFASRTCADLRQQKPDDKAKPDGKPDVQKTKAS